jgi:succinate dehydrogenase flavin-adding protein (antitoxin of CptAB toxin-antitoxin module)
MAYTTMNGRIVPVWSMPTKPKVETYSISYTEDTIVKMRELKKVLVQLLVSKQHHMDEDEKMEIFKIDEQLYNWINNPSTTSASAKVVKIEDVVVKASKVLKTYGKAVSMP